MAVRAAGGITLNNTRRTGALLTPQGRGQQQQTPAEMLGGEGGPPPPSRVLQPAGFRQPGKKTLRLLTRARTSGRPAAAVRGRARAADPSNPALDYKVRICSANNFPTVCSLWGPP